MSLTHSPSIVTNGLVLYTDMSNTQKSWKGAPTTNQVVTVPYTLTTYTACSGPVNAVVVDATGKTITVNRYTINTTGGTPRARIIATGLTTGVNYSYSLKIRYNGGAFAQTWYIDSSKGNPEGSNNTFNSNVSNSTYIGNGWYQLTLSFNFATCPTGGAWANFGLVAPDGTYLNQTFDAYDIQFEQSAYATPFVAGTRSNTQAILDLTNNVTITANSLTYAADNTFSFNGSSDYITIPSNQLALTLWTQPWTLGVWMYVPASATWSDGANRSHFVSKGATAGSWGIIRGTTDNTIYAAIRTDAGIYQASGGSITRDAWCNVVGTWDGISAVRTYINGVLVGSATAATLSGVPDTSNLFVGRSVNTVAGSPGLFYNGKVSNVVGYTRALTAAEVNQNFNALRGRYSL